MKSLRHFATARASMIARIHVVLLSSALAACTRSDARTESPATQGATHDTSKSASAFTITPEQRARIHVQTITLTPYTPVVQTTGTVQFNGDHSTQVLATIGGPVTRIFVETGAHVSRGTPLAAVSSPDFAAAVATYRKAESAAQNLRRIATQDQQLFTADALARRDLEQAQTDAASADADLESARQQLIALGVSNDMMQAIRENHPTGPLESVIRSPIGGVVVERLVTPGQLLSAGSTPVFTIADLSTMWVSANVFETDLAQVARGQHATISSDASPRPIVGTVDYIAALVDSASKATGVRIVVPNPGQVLKRDMYVRVAIQGRTHQQGMLVSTMAVLHDDENLPFVFVERGDGSFVRRQVTLGTQVDDSYVIRDGLSVGDKVVTEGALFLQFAESQ